MKNKKNRRLVDLRDSFVDALIVTVILMVALNIVGII